MEAKEYQEEVARTMYSEAQTMATDIVMHDYDSFQFGQLAEDTQLGKKLVPKGYVNLTATDKLFTLAFKNILKA